MKTRLIIMCLLLGCCAAHAQLAKETKVELDTEHFTVIRTANDKEGFSLERMLPKEDRFQQKPGWKMGTYLIPDGMKEAFLNGQIDLLSPYFSSYLATLSAEDLKIMKTIEFRYHFDKEFRFLGYTIVAPAGLVDNHPEMERLCWEFGKSLKHYDISPYGISFNTPAEVNYGFIPIRMAYLVNKLLRDR